MTWRFEVARGAVGLLGLILMLALGSPACSDDSPTAPSPSNPPPGAITEVPASLPPRTALENAIKDHYARLFNEPVFRPAIVNQAGYVDCSGQGHLTSTLFLRDSAQPGISRVRALYTSRDGAQVERQFDGAFLTPAGVFRVLVAVLTWPDTVVEADRGLWEAAQASINADHAAFSAARGFSPVVRFDSTNVFLPGQDVANPRDRQSVIAALAARGIDVSSYDILMSVHIEPSVGAGGVAFPNASVKPAFLAIGNFSSFRAPLTPDAYRSIASAAYHHEVAHHWGWPGTHDWTPSCGGITPSYRPLITEPKLFGWEDLDGDRVPEILDSTPYGRSR